MDELPVGQGSPGTTAVRVGIGEERNRDGARLRVEVLADVEIGAVVAGHAVDALVARPAEVRTSPPVGFGTRSISSQVSQPTSPIQTSDVPGRTAIRNGLRKP